MRFSKIYGPPSLVLVFGLIASLAIFALALRVESRVNEAEFEALARDRVLAIRATVDEQLEEVHSLSGLLSSIENLGREEFHEFTQHLLDGAGEVQALEWIPRVPASRRAEFESRARREGFPDFEFTELQEGSMRRAGSRAEYFPVYYLEPVEGNEAALGFDLLSDPARRLALRNCVESGMPTASAPVTLVQDASEQTGVLMFFPVYEDSEFEGVVLGVLRVGDLLTRALSRLQDRPIGVSLYDVTQPDAPNFLARARGGQLLPESGTGPPGLTKVRQSVPVAGRIWMVSVSPAADYEPASGSPGPLGMLGVGIFATMSLAGFLVHRVRVEQRVREYERELAHLARVATSGELAASIAHEINQPLCAIVLNAQAAKRLSAPDQRELGPVLDRIVEDGERAGETIRNLREFVRDGDTVQRPVNLEFIVRGTVELFRATDLARHPVEVRVQQDLPDVVANEVQIQQVLLNLLRNAADAEEAIGSADQLISVSVAADESRMVVTSIDDAGPGLDAAEVERVFAPFFTTKEAGMGMGLSICKSIVESHGGRIWTNSSRTGGARFSFSLPTVDGA